MTKTHSLFLFGHEFDEFLSASIGEEENGMDLSVMSALARRNVDPWHEAARLSLLPRDVATQELCVMIAELRPGGPNRASPRSIAERLIAPLPLSARSKASSPRTGAGRSMTRGETARTAVVLFFLLLIMGFSIGLQSGAVEHVPAPPSSAGASLGSPSTRPIAPVQSGGPKLLAALAAQMFREDGDRRPRLRGAAQSANGNGS